MASDEDAPDGAAFECGNDSIGRNLRGEAHNAQPRSERRQTPCDRCPSARLRAVRPEGGLAGRTPFILLRGAGDVPFFFGAGFELGEMSVLFAFFQGLHLFQK